MRLRGVLLLLVPIALTSGAAGASCRDEHPSWADVTLVRVQSIQLDGTPKHPNFELTMERRKGQWESTLRHVSETPFRHGTYITHTSERLYHRLVKVLQRDDFLDMRLLPGDQPSVDTSDDIVAIGRCGVVITVTSRPLGTVDIDPSTDEARRFFSLVGDISHEIYAQSWTRISNDSGYDL